MPQEEGRVTHIESDMLAVYQTSSGRLRAATARGLVHTRGVPYATASRFGTPTAVDSPDVERDALVRGPVCPQDPRGSTR